MDKLPSESTELVEVSGSKAKDKALAELLDGPKYTRYARFVFAVLGSIPWIGGLLGASAALHAENEQGVVNELMRRWLEEHRQKIEKLSATINEMTTRLEQLGPQVDARLQDESYLALVRQGFLTWDEASTETKRDYVRRALTNAASSQICSDDVVRMFLDWIDRYDETHFKVMRVLFRNRGATRAFMWEEISGDEVREDSAEADLFKLLIHDLSMGHVLRQIRNVNDQGAFLKRRRRPSRFAKSTLESAFEDTKPYELTALGQQFATYVMNETVPRIGR